MENGPDRPIIGRLTVSFDQVDSTNDLALRWIAKSKPIHGTVITAGFQAKGRGQIGRTWFGSPGKNIAYTVILFPSGLVAAMAPMALMALSSGILKGVAACSGLEQLRLKWPNDLYWKDSKLGGMLMQTALSGHQVQHIVFGAGININEDHFPPDLENPVSLFQITGSQYPLPDLVSALHSSLDEAFGKISIHDWTGIHKEYEGVLYARGQIRPFMNLVSGERFHALVDGVSEEGKLRLRIENEDRYFNIHELKWL